jgi:bifunctional DNA-binding transcriptional regulator/antitoxin component of YhaV-PrlF toxin-antitoxin module
MDAAIVKLSSKGQLVLPTSMRSRSKMKMGSKVMLIQQGDSIVLKSLDAMSKDMEEEMDAMSAAAAGWKEIEAGRSKKLSKDEFLHELKSW